MEREKGGVLQLKNTFPKIDLRVLDVLLSKHPKACPPSAHSLEAYRDKPLAMVLVDITDAKVVTVAR